MEWTGPIVTTVGAAVAALFAWLTTRDKLRFDADKVRLQSNMDWLREKVEECQDDRSVLEAKDAQQQAEINELRKRVDDASRQHIALIERRQASDPGYGGPERRQPPPVEPE